MRSIPKQRRRSKIVTLASPPSAIESPPERTPTQGGSASDRSREQEFADTAADLRRRLSDTLSTARQAVTATQRLVAEAQALRATRPHLRAADLNDRTQSGVGRALRESERAIALRDQFVALVAHEMRQPLQAAAAATVLLESDTPAEARQRAAGVLRRQVNRLSRLVEDLLESARLAAHGIDLQLQQMDLRVLMERAVRDVRHHIETRRQELIVSSPSQPEPFVADEFRVHQVCINLLENAARYTPDGGRVWFDGRRSGTEIQLSVRDTGPGIPLHVQPSLFDMFTRASRIGSGVGVGLAVVRRLVTLHDGRIDVNSAPGQGSEFIVRLPVMGPSRYLGDRAGLRSGA